MPIWARLVVAAAALRVAVALAFYLAGIYNVGLEAPLPAGVYAALVVSFGALGLLLVAAARDDDVRAAWLGGVLLLLAVPMTSRLLAQTGISLATFLGRLQPGAFLPAFLWRFVSEFPSPLPPSQRTPARRIADAAASFGAVAFAINCSFAFWPASAQEPDWRRWLTVVGDDPSSLYWPIVFLVSAAAAVALVVRMLRSAREDRPRVRIFVGGLALGFMPLFVEIAVEELWPAYAEFVHSPAIEPWVAVLLFGPLALVPLITAYSVVYDRVVDTRLVIRDAIQHALARYTIAVATLIPFVALVFYLFQHRTESLIALMSGPRPLILAAAIGGGVLSLRSRGRILNAIDRRFFREVYDAQLLVTTLVSDQLMTGSLAEIAGRLRAEIDRALHARADLFVLDDEGFLLQDPSGRRRPLEARAMLLSLAMADPHPMDVQLGATSPLSRLPDEERSWIVDGGYELMLGIRSRAGEPVGLLALTGKRSELPFSGTDRRCIGALAGPLGLAIENDRLRRAPDSATTAPARECSECAKLHASTVRRCVCGGMLTEAAVPHVLRGVFRFEKRIGSGGMGVVYRATDMSLRRQVAIKTLPRLTPQHAAQLEREAQAMASLNHTNLAVIYGIESWRSTPFLVEEYMAGGTLADRLRSGPIAVAEALDLGIALTGVLAQLHASGIVHRDLKPSNIGFSQTGVVKLVDFGIAHLLRSATNLETTTLNEAAHGQSGAAMVRTKQGVSGTPAYMSPEAAGGAPPSPSFDLWSLAVVLFEALAGQRPFAGRTASEILLQMTRGPGPDLLSFRPDCPAVVARFFDRALAPEIQTRATTASELRAQLLALRQAVTLS